MDYFLWFFRGRDDSSGNDSVHPSNRIGAYRFFFQTLPVLAGLNTALNERINVLFSGSSFSSSGVPKAARSDTFMQGQSTYHELIRKYNLNFLAFTSLNRVILLQDILVHTFLMQDLEYDAKSSVLRDGFAKPLGKLHVDDNSDPTGVFDYLRNAFQPAPLSLSDVSLAMVNHTPSSSSVSSLFLPKDEGKLPPFETTIVSWNVAFFKFFSIVTHHHHNMLPNVPRSQKVAEFLTAHYGDAGVLALQEVFDTRTINILIDGLSESFPYHVKPHRKAWRTMNSGLMLFSKFPILDVHVEAFKHGKGDEMWASKGFMAACLQPPDQREPFVVYNTHLQAGLGTTAKLAQVFGKKYRDKESAAIRDQQMQQLAQHMETWTPRGLLSFQSDQTHGDERKESQESKKKKTLRTFLCGDLNSNLHTTRSAHGISSGKSWAKHQLYHSDNAIASKGNPHPSKNSVKYAHKHYLLSKLLSYTLPSNFTCIRSSGMQKGIISDVDWKLIDNQRLFTSSLAKPRQWDPKLVDPLTVPATSTSAPSQVCAESGRLIDIIACDADIDSSKGESLDVRIEDCYGLSDHHILVGTYRRGGYDISCSSPSSDST